MKKWLLHIIYIGVTGILAWSCTNNFDEEFTPEEAKQINVTFTLAMESPRSRAVAEETGNDYENRIDADGLQVLFYSEEDGTCLGKVKDVSVVRTENNYIYRFVGNLTPEGKYTDYTLPKCKVMIFANCPTTVDEISSATDLAALSFEYTPDDYKNGKKNIPMWGVASYTNLQLTPGSRTDLGTIYILRAMAKVEVALSTEMSLTYELAGVSFNSYNRQGYCLPEFTSFSSLTTTPELDTEKVLKPYFSPENSSLPFSNGLVYVPEYQNDGNLSITVSLKHRETNETKDYSISFSEYSSGMAGSAMDVIRNHYYSFVVTAVTPDDVEAKVFYNVELWDSKTINIPGFK